MGKKSLTKSTAKKKTTTSAKKKSPEKKTAAASAKKGKTQKNTTKTKSKKPTLKSLRKKQFDTWSPEKLFVPEPDPAAKNAFTAPPITGDYDKDQAETIRALLLWDLNEPSPVAKAKPPEPEAESESKPEAEKKAAPEPPPLESKPEEKPAASEANAGPQTQPQAEGKPENTPEPEKKPAPEKKTEKAKPSEKPDSKKDSGSGGGAAGPPGGGPPEPPKPPVAEKKEPPLDPKLLALIAIVGLLFVLIIGASLKNADNYYLKQTDKAIEIWKGKFSPRGQEKIVTLPGRQAPEKEKEVYSRQEALAPAYHYFMDRADALSEAEDLIDFQAIHENLQKAKQYATTDHQKQRVNQRLERMDYLMLLYKADVAAEKQTLQGLENAMEFLDQAAALDISERAERVLEDRMAAAQEAADALEEKAAAEQAAKAQQAAETKKAAEPETASQTKQAGENQQQDAQPAPEPDADAAEETKKKADENSDKQSGQDSQDSDDPGVQAESDSQ